MEPIIASAPPAGFWIKDGRGKWMGPFGIEQVALCMLQPYALEAIRRMGRGFLKPSTWRFYDV